MNDYLGISFNYYIYYNILLMGKKTDTFDYNIHGFISLYNIYSSVLLYITLIPIIYCSIKFLIYCVGTFLWTFHLGTKTLESEVITKIKKHTYRTIHAKKLGLWV